MNIIKLYQDHNIRYDTQGKNVSEGWVATRCCWCGDASNHLGYNTETDVFFCWKCGKHPVPETISRLLKVPLDEAYLVLRTYGRKHKPLPKPERVQTKPFTFPSGTGPLLPQHKQYLIGRNFDPEKLEQEWGLLGTGPVSVLDNIDYKHRIVAPIKWMGQVVSFQGRTIAKVEPKYKACPQEREIVKHKDILYGKQEEWGSIGICVEGITDVWRFGPTSFAVFGIKYKSSQVQKMVANFNQIIVIFDDEDHAQEQADILVAELRMSGVGARKEVIKGDPGAMPQDEADYLVKQIIKG